MEDCLKVGQLKVTYQVWRSQVLKQANRLLCSNLQKKATSHICTCTVVRHDAQAHL